MKTSAAVAPSPRTPAISNGVFGMSLFVAVEILFFAGLLSAYIVTRQGITEWPPPDQPRLPIPVTLFNTLLLLASGFLLFRANKIRFQAEPWKGKFHKIFATSVLLGALFLVFQGWEWVQLIKHGLTLKSSIYGSTFYVIVGAHALHVLGAIFYLGYILSKLRNGKTLLREHFAAAQVFWYFVVGVWPIIFVTLYVL